MGANHKWGRTKCQFNLRVTIDKLSILFCTGVRPIFNDSETVQVKHGMALIEILDLDSESRLLEVNVWERYVRKFVHILNS